MFKSEMAVVNALISMSFVCSASDKYRGSIQAQLVEQNGNVFHGNNNRNPTIDIPQFPKKNVVYLNQSSGQKVYLGFNNLLFDSNKNSKYHFKFDILENTDDSYKAIIKLFENAIEDNDKGKNIVVSRQILEEEITGSFNSKNDYSFFLDEKPNFKVTLFIDKVFSKQELIKRLTKAKQLRLQSD